jgi:membrane-associated phospholipid phosphatase
VRISNALALVCLTTGVALADEPTGDATEVEVPDPSTPPAAPAQAAPPARTDENRLEPIGWKYLYDGGAIPFFWVPAGVTLGLALFAEPPATPRLFSETEGGAEPKDDTVPNVAVAVYVVAGLGAIAAIPVARSVRAFHLKGYAEAMTTTATLTEVAKVTFGRHRPSWTPATDEADMRKSFFSGHASLTFGTSTYLGFYLHDHVFSEWRDPGQAFAAWELLPLGALAAGSVAVAASRVHDNRHNVSDVVTGAVVGTGISVGIYLWQESRYQSALAHAQRPREASLFERVRLVPSTDSVHVVGQW